MATTVSAAPGGAVKSNGASRRPQQRSRPGHRRMALDDLRQYAASLGLDTLGPHSALVARIDLLLAMQAAEGGNNSLNKDNAASNTDGGGEAKESEAATTGTQGAAQAGKKRRKKKKAAAAASSAASANNTDADATTKPADGVEDADVDAVIEYVPEPLLVDMQDDSALDAFAGVLAKFAPKDDEGQEGDGGDGYIDIIPSSNVDENGMDVDDSDDDEDADGANKPVSKKKLRKLQRLTVAELKQLVRKPEVVEWIDVTASDPKLLVHLKAYRNTVPVPSHWSLKRAYLQNKRGFEKPPFDLPDFIKQTGIMQIREAVKEKEEATKLKGKTRERHQPKMGKLEIDYQKLHDAFFRWQTRPKLSLFGDLYYEGKEFETKLKCRKPGDLSDELKFALNIPPSAPPPWLINMQRYGPPPSYPRLKIPGLNAPLPEGAHWGYHPGGWGKPPVDEFNRPLYGDVFGLAMHNVAVEGADKAKGAVDDEEEDEQHRQKQSAIDRSHWGELEPEVEEEEEEEVSDGEGDEDEDEEGGSGSGLDANGLVTPSGISSVPSGMETPDFLELRKRPVPGMAGSGSETADTPQPEPKQLYKVLDQRETSIRGFMGSQYVYDVSGGNAGAPESTNSKTAAAKRKLGIAPTSVEVTLNPDELAADPEAAAASAVAASSSGINAETIKRKYDEEAQAARANATVTHEDFSDLVAEHAQKQAKKRQKKEDAAAGGGTTPSGSAKKDKTKEFKF